MGFEGLLLRRGEIIMSMRKFNPVKVGQYETANWVAYYQKRWPKLLVYSIGMVKEAFGLTWPQALYGAYLVAKAEIAAAPFPDNDIPTAQAYMTRFYQMVKAVHGEGFEVEKAATLDVEWWVVHRQLFARPDNQPLIEALTNLYAEVYGLPAAQVRDAAFYRAEAMQYSDKWVNEGRVADSPLIQQIENELVKSYVALRRAVDPEYGLVPAGATAASPSLSPVLVGLVAMVLVAGLVYLLRRPTQTK